MFFTHRDGNGSDDMILHDDMGIVRGLRKPGEAEAMRNAGGVGFEVEGGYRVADWHGVEPSKVFGVSYITYTEGGSYQV
jgi:hypothetical protein